VLHAAFGTVLLIVCVVSLVIAVLALTWNRRTWEEYGKRGLILESEQPGSAEPPPGSPADAAQREDEIRELLEARNARRARRGEALLNVEEEISALSEPTAGAPRPDIDPELRAEIRQLVVARSERLVRAGKPPLDVEHEVQRQIDALGDRGHGEGVSG
jgi:hypothetical protein